MSRRRFGISRLVLLAAAVIVLGIAGGVCAAAEQDKGKAAQILTAAEAQAAADAADRALVRVNPDGSVRNLLLEMQDRLAAKRAADGMMRGVTSRQRWEAAKRQADRLAEAERARAGQPQGKGGAK